MRGRIAYMPQGLGRNLYPTLSVFENIDFFGRLFGLSATERRANPNNREEINVLEDGERRVEVAAEALRHIGDAADASRAASPDRRCSC